MIARSSGGFRRLEAIIRDAERKVVLTIEAVTGAIGTRLGAVALIHNGGGRPR